MVENYINGTKVSKSKISADIKNRKLSRADIQSLLREIDDAVAAGKLSDPYIGKSYTEKVDKAEWNTQYLDELVAVASSSECFNEDYLLYLADVAKHVNSGGKKMIKKILFALVMLFVAFCAGFFVAYKIIEVNETTVNETSGESEDSAEMAAKHAEEIKNLQKQYETVAGNLSDTITKYQQLFEDVWGSPIPEAQFYIKYARLDLIDSKKLAKHYRESKVKAQEIADEAKKMNLSKTDLEKVCESLEMADKEKDPILNKYEVK